MPCPHQVEKAVQFGGNLFIKLPEAIIYYPSNNYSSHHCENILFANQALTNDSERIGGYIHHGRGTLSRGMTAVQDEIRMDGEAGANAGGGGAGW